MDFPVREKVLGTDWDSWAGGADTEVSVMEGDILLACLVLLKLNEDDQKNRDTGLYKTFMQESLTGYTALGLSSLRKCARDPQAALKNMLEVPAL